MIVRDFLICLLQMYLLEDLEKNMLPYRRENFLGKFLVYFVIALVMLGINHLESSIFNMVMIPVTYMIVSMVVFRGNIWKKLVIVCCYYVLAIIPEFLFATLTNAYGVTGASEGFGTEIEKTLALLLMSTMTFLFIKCINQVTRKRDYLTIENKTFTVLLMLPTATIIILGCVFYSNISFEGMNRVMVPVGASLLLLTNIFIFSVFDRFVEKSEEVKKMARLYQKSRAEIANLQYMNKVNEDNRAFLHDINKFICTVAGLMEEGENQEVKEIMEHLGVRIQSLQKGVYCEHPILNSILCERKFLAESKNISYKITLGNDLRLDFLEELDMISIVGNLLDNALEAAEKTKDGRYVECRMYMGNGILGEFTNNAVISYQEKTDSLLDAIRATQEQMWRLVQYRKFEGSNILKMLSSGRAGKAIMPVVFTCMLEGNVSKVTKKRYSFKEEYAISQTPQVVLDHHVRDDLGYLKISWDYIIDIFDKQYITDIFGAYVNNIKKFMEKY